MQRRHGFNALQDGNFKGDFSNTVTINQLVFIYRSLFIATKTQNKKNFKAKKP